MGQLAVLTVALAMAGMGPAALAQMPDAGTVRAVVVDHVALHVADPAASAAFYSGLFGFATIPLANPRVRWLAIGNGVELHLIGGRTAPVGTPRQVHLAFRSSDLQPIVARLDAQGVEWGDFNGTKRAIDSGRADGVRQVFFRDPDGYLIEANDAAAPERRRP